MSFQSLEQMVVASAEAVRPVERITVSEAAERYHIAKAAGVSAGKFDLSLTPYLREPMDVLTSNEFTGMAFAGPARSGKSAMAINWLCHTAITDPSDMLFVHMAQHTARLWSMQDLEKAINDSPELRKRLRPGRQNDNVFDKAFMNGMRAMITWPTIKNLSGLTVKYQFILDMDRIKPQLIDGEAHVYDATRKRGGTFKRRAMCAAEGSPGFPVNDAKWLPSTLHEAPPCEGILSIYNRGDRRRWYWECPQCAGKFEPHFKHLRWPSIDSMDPMEAAEQVVMVCPHDGYPMGPKMQRELNSGGRWIKDGQIWLPSGEITGVARRSRIASFWLFGPAAGFTDWTHLVTQYLDAEAVFNKTGDEGPLMTTVNVDQGDAYTPKALEAGRLPEALKSRAEDWGGSPDDPVVPDGVRFLVATVDVQAGGRPSFVVHVFGIGANNDIWHVDMFKIRKSIRPDDDGGFKLLDPAAFPEDWDLLVDRVMERTYPLGDGSGRRMQIKLTACDSGGAEGVTANAYDFYRRLRQAGKHRRFHLLKGAPSKAAPRLHMTMPDSQQRDKFAIARGDVPVWLVNSNIVKDQVSNMLGREEPGAMIHFPAWAEDWLYTQLTTEIRDDQKGAWINPSRRRNEAFDLLAYCVAICLHPDIRIEQVNWENPPGWAREWDRNDLVFMPTPDGGMRFVAPVEDTRSLSDLGDALL